MSLCTRYLSHQPHGNSFSNGEQNPLSFVRWWLFFLFCLLKFCHKTTQKFQNAASKGHWQKSTGLRDTLSLVPADTKFCPWSPRPMRAQPWAFTFSAPAVPPLVIQCCIWASQYHGTALLRRWKTLFLRRQQLPGYGVMAFLRSHCS